MDFKKKKKKKKNLSAELKILPRDVIFYDVRNRTLRKMTPFFHAILWYYVV